MKRIWSLSGTKLAAMGATIAALGVSSSVSPNMQIYCGYCSVNCSAPAHDFVANGIPFLAGGNHSCFIFPASGCPHGQCGIALDDTRFGTDLETVRRAVADDGGLGAEAVERLVRRYPNRAYLDRGRGVLQVAAACDKNVVIGQLVLPARVLAAASNGGRAGTSRSGGSFGTK